MAFAAGGTIRQETTNRRLILQKVDAYVNTLEKIPTDKPTYTAATNRKLYPVSISNLHRWAGDFGGVRNTAL